MNAIFEKLKTYFTSTAGLISGAIAAALVAAVTAAMSPLGGTLRDMIWREKIEVNQHISLVEKKREKFSLVVTDVSRGTGLSGGHVTLRPPDDEAVVLHGPTDFTYPAADGSINVSPEGLTVEGRLPGKSQIFVSIVTNRGRRFTGRVDVRTAATRPIPTNLDFSTTDWLMVLNRQEGSLTIKEDPHSHRFAGTASMEDGTTYAVKGWRDGTIFHAGFRLPGTTAPGPIIYKIEGIYCEMGAWLIVNAKVATYRDGVLAPNPVPLQTITQRCPKFADVIAVPEGDGAFWASVATQ
jgi:hypothetical protein